MNPPWSNQLQNTTYSQGQSGVLGGQAGLAQMQAKQAAYMQAPAGMAAQAMPKTKEEPKNEFLEKVRKIYMKRVEFKIRMAMGIGGMVMLAMGPVIGFELYRLWRWSGVFEDASQIGGVVISLAAMILGGILVGMSIHGEFAKEMAGDWVLERERK